MKYMLVASDPLISTLHKRKHHMQKRPLSPEVLALLEPSRIYMSDVVDQSVSPGHVDGSDSDSTTDNDIDGEGYMG